MISGVELKRKKEKNLAFNKRKIEGEIIQIIASNNRNN